MKENSHLFFISSYFSRFSFNCVTHAIHPNHHQRIHISTPANTPCKNLFFVPKGTKVWPAPAWVYIHIAPSQRNKGVSVPPLIFVLFHPVEMDVFVSFWSDRTSQALRAAQTVQTNMPTHETTALCNSFKQQNVQRNDFILASVVSSEERCHVNAPSDIELYHYTVSPEVYLVWPQMLGKM